jgi:hypothetical protein
MPKRYNNTIYKLFFKSKKTIKVTLNNITRIRLIIYNNNNLLINVWYGSYRAYIDYSVTEGKTYVFIGRKPL